MGRHGDHQPRVQADARLGRGTDLPHEYSLSSDWDNRWRTGGSVDEVIEEAHLDPAHILEGIERFVRERDSRLARLREMADAAANR